MYWHEKKPLAVPAPSSHAYRLKLWPAIPDQFRTARVLRACSRMSVGPVTVNWFLEATGLEPHEAAELVASLERQGAIERIALGGGEAAPTPVARLAPPALEEPAGRGAHRLPWRQAAMIAFVGAGLTAALEPGLRAGLDLSALLELPALWG